MMNLNESTVEEAALEWFEEIFQAKKGTNENDEADAPAMVIKDYEERHFLTKPAINHGTKA